MDLKTIHANRLNAGFDKAIASALRQKGIGLNVRIITCGKAIVILPDTDLSKPCTTHELSKALHTNIVPENSETSYTPCRLSCASTGKDFLVQLSEPAKRFLEFLEEYDFEDEGFEVEYNPREEDYKF